MKEQQPPVEEGDILRDKECEAVGRKGDGIFREKRYVILVPAAKHGKKYDIKVTKTLPNVGFGEIHDGGDADE